MLVTLGTWNIFFALNLWYSAMREEDTVSEGCRFAQPLATSFDGYAIFRAA